MHLSLQENPALRTLATDREPLTAEQISALSDREFFARQHATYVRELLSDRPWLVEGVEAMARVADAIDAWRKGQPHRGDRTSAEYLVGMVEVFASECRDAVREAKAAPIC